MGPPKLLGLEFGRGLAALTVAMGHSQLVGLPVEIASVTWIFTKLAVAFFFVLSGFIILHVHGSDIDHPERGANYCWRRLLRIFPTYWLVLTIDITLHLLAGRDVPHDLQSILQQILLLPGDEPYISVAWSLRHELLFYGLFLIFILNQKLGFFVFGCWFLLISNHFIEAGWHPEIWPPSDTLTSPINFGFFVGAGIAILHRLKPVEGGNIHGSLANVCVWCGAISYPLYLCHPTVYFLSGGLLKRLDIAAQWQVQLIFVTCVSLVAATIISKVFEKKLITRLRNYNWFAARYSTPASR